MPKFIELHDNRSAFWVRADAVRYVMPNDTRPGGSLLGLADLRVDLDVNESPDEVLALLGERRREGAPTRPPTPSGLDPARPSGIPPAERHATRA